MLVITLTTTGSFENVGVFLKQIQQKLPISETTIVDGDGFSTNITLHFYQKRFPRIIFKDDEPITPLSAQNLTLLEKISDWQPAFPQEEDIGSESAGSIPLF